MAAPPLAYRNADPDEEEFLQSVRDKWHEHLDGYALGLFFRNQPQVLDGRKCAATANKANALFQHMTGLDGWIDVWEEHWSPETEDWRQYLLDHELSHFTVNTKGKFCTIGHDIEDFETVLARHSADVSGLRRIIETQAAEDAG